MLVISIFRAAIIALLPIVAAITPSLAEGFDHTTRTGIVYLGKGWTPLLEIPSTNTGRPPSLEAGAEVSLVIVEPGGAQRLVQAKIAGAAVSVPPGNSPLHHDGATVDTTRYKLAIIGNAELRPGATGFGIAGIADRCGARNSVVSCDLEPGGPPQFFRICASREGLHYSIWSGKPLDGARRWRAYYYLGYDVEPDCAAGDYAD